MLVVAAFGLFGPNAWFVWHMLSDFDRSMVMLSQPMAASLMLEALGLLLLLAVLIRRSGRRPGALCFVLLSLAGGLLFSVPMWLWLASRPDSKTS